MKRCTYRVQCNCTPHRTVGCRTPR